LLCHAPASTHTSSLSLHDALPISLLLGADAAQELSSWHEVEALPGLAELAVFARPGAAVPRHRLIRRVLEVPGVEVSATLVRERVRRGLSIRYLVPDAVRDYIAARGLYRSRTDAQTSRHEGGGHPLPARAQADSAAGGRDPRPRNAAQGPLRRRAPGPDAQVPRRHRRAYGRACGGGRAPAAGQARLSRRPGATAAVRPAGQGRAGAPPRRATRPGRSAPRSPRHPARGIAAAARQQRGPHLARAPLGPGPLRRSA